MEANKIESGKTKGTIRGIENNKNFKTIIKSRSLPVNSEINNQTVCSINIKNRIVNTDKSVVEKVLRR